jgi:histidyl-tRNA synthetase
MPLAKSSVVETPPQPTQTLPPPTGIAGYEWAGIPIDVFRAFGVEMGTIPVKDIEQLKDIVSWAKSKTDEPTVGNVLQQIIRLRRELGAPAYNQKGYEKVWSFVKMQKHIDELTKRQDSLKTGERWL